MSLWWIPVGIAAWFLVAVAVGLCIGPVLGRKERQVTPGWLSAGSAIARREQNVTL